VSSCILAEENTSRIKEIQSLAESSGNRHIHFSESAEGETSFPNPTLSSQLVFFSPIIYIYIGKLHRCQWILVPTLHPIFMVGGGAI
jgi:hypothetical protein